MVAVARAALAELDADEPDRSTAQLMGGALAWDQSPVTAADAARDPTNAPTMRPHLIAACQKLQKHPALRLHCACGRGLEFLAIAPFATGALVVSSPRLVGLHHRTGGTGDLGSVEDNDPTHAWSLDPWEAWIRTGKGAHVSAYVPADHPILGAGAQLMGDAARRQTFSCTGCGATHTFSNVTLLRMVLRTIALGDRKVRLGSPAMTARPSRA